MGDSKLKNSDIPSDSSSEVSQLSSRVDTLSQLVQEFMSTVAAQSAAIEPVRPRPSDVCLSPGSNSSTPLTLRHKPATVELSRFNGLNPEAWLFQAERYFEFYNILPDHQLSLASFYLDGEALDWYRWMFRNKQLIDWPHFTGKIRIRLGSITQITGGSAIKANADHDCCGLSGSF